ncbi:hypothetical protein RFI_27092 [Reticulomyxa filosa]|uniref:Uncharacterized protein n=1 Tax=Reticulomyxa filosa TaxID=46433 RepID=X6M9H0_RETFI|nr:hypothetical protein RFI_27092 [Reticulomyxa filosa]|eukprot:ETO10286.1 hypothetical protein RFI_27092 [Reticulomyxa filosa]
MNEANKSNCNCGLNCTCNGPTQDSTASSPTNRHSGNTHDKHIENGWSPTTNVHLMNTIQTTHNNVTMTTKNEECEMEYARRFVMGTKCEDIDVVHHYVESVCHRKKKNHRLNAWDLTNPAIIRDSDHLQCIDSQHFRYRELLPANYLQLWTKEESIGPWQKKNAHRCNHSKNEPLRAHFALMKKFLSFFFFK